MKKFLVFLAAILLVFGMVGMAGAIPFSTSNDYSGSGTYGGESYIRITAPGQLTDTFDLTGLCAAEITEASLSITHRYANNWDFELWVASGNNAIEIGTLSYSDINWVKDDFDLSSSLLDSIKDSGWIASLTITDTNSKTGGVADFASATLSGNYAPVPEPATMLLLGSGLIGLVGLGRKKFFKKS